MWKPDRARAEQHFAGSQNKSDNTIKQKEKTERDRDDRMARLRDLRLAKEANEAAGQKPAENAPAAEQPAPPEGTEELSEQPHPHQS